MFTIVALAFMFMIWVKDSVLNISIKMTFFGLMVWGVYESTLALPTMNGHM